MPDSLHDLTRAVDAFAIERDWHQFHAPKNIASALIVEAAELLEPFQWMSEQQSREPVSYTHLTLPTSDLV